jgi:hypothetical protein
MNMTTTVLQCSCADYTRLHSYYCRHVAGFFEATTTGALWRYVSSGASTIPWLIPLIGQTGLTPAAFCFAIFDAVGMTGDDRFVDLAVDVVSPLDPTDSSYLQVDMNRFDTLIDLSKNIADAFVALSVIVTSTQVCRSPFHIDRPLPDLQANDPRKMMMETSDIIYKVTHQVCAFCMTSYLGDS